MASTDARVPAADAASHNDEKHSHLGSSDSSIELVKEEQGVDVVVGIFRGHAEEGMLAPEVARAVRAKLDWNLLPCLFVLYTIQFLDKNSLGAASILDLFRDTHITPNQFNSLGTAFYLGYLVFLFPHAYIMQTFPISKWISINIALWSLFIAMQTLAKNFGTLFALRFLLGMSEGCITTGLMTLIPMFYNRTEITERIGWTFQCNGVAQILAGFLSFGVAHGNPTGKPARWQIYMILMALLSLGTSALFFWHMPDNPTSARFLNEDDKVNVVKRITINQNGIETKKWKRSQFIEALKDSRAWLWGLFALVADLQGGLGIEYAQIIKGFGFTTLETTLLNIPSGVTMILGITIGGILLRRFPNGRTVIGPLAFVPGIISCIVLIFLPFEQKKALMAQIYIINFGGCGFVMSLSLCAVMFAGHTKKMTCNAIFFAGYAIGQMLNTQFWLVKYRPRNRVPWTIVMFTFVFDIIFLVCMRFILIRENKRRDAEKEASGKDYEEFGFIEHTNEDGTIIKLKVPIQFLDLTDKENKAFRYPM